MQYAFERPADQDRPDIQELVERVRRIRSTVSIGVECEVSDFSFGDEENCPECDGTGVVPECPEDHDELCERCHGTGGDPEHREKCEVCLGEGHHGTPCHVCHGTGRKECVWCDGTGYIPCIACSGRGWRRAQCRECHGTGRAKCAECGRREPDMIECPECGGDGTIPAGADVPEWAENWHSEHCGTEFTGRFLPTYDRPEEFEESVYRIATGVAMTAEEYGTDGPCGLHVHVGKQDRPGHYGGWPASVVGAAVRIWRQLEDIVWEAADPKHERHNYCEPNEDYPSKPNEYVSRYRAMNAWPAWREHGTVEFRLWNSTEDADYVAMAILVSSTVLAMASVMTEDGAEWDRNTVLAVFQESLPGWVVDWIELAAGVSLREAV